MSAVNPLFKNETLQTQFEKNGFVKVPLLNVLQVNELNDFFAARKELHVSVTNLHHTTTDTQNPELIYEVDAKIKSVFLPELEKILIDFKGLAGCFHIKEPGIGSETGIHQDPTFVDENNFCSANVWVALQDIDKTNGNLFFVSGSNHAITSLRVTPSFPTYYQDFQQALSEMVTHVSLKKGEAVIFNNATIHAATENLSNDIRLAATLLVCSAPAQWLLYYQEKGARNNEIEKYHLDVDTFFSFARDAKPDKKAFKEFVSYEYPKLTKEEFLNRVGVKRNYLQRIADIFRMKTAV